MFKRIRERREEKARAKERIIAKVRNIYTGEIEEVKTDRAGLTGLAIAGCYDLIEVVPA